MWMIPDYRDFTIGSMFKGTDQITSAERAAWGGGNHALDLDSSGGRPGVHGLPVPTESGRSADRRGSSGCGYHRPTAGRPAALHELHGSSNGGRPAAAECRGVVPTV